MLENVLKRGEVEGGDLTFWEAWSSMVSDDMCDESCSTIFDENRYFADRSLSRFGGTCRVSSKGKSGKTCDRLFQDLQNC